ncbi:hypothetical protein FGCSD_0840 [Streptococcus dysgalactiae]|nr:hypothetical protein FGCSD_0840 [Streptococcus dysgalactiae]
MTHFLGKDWRNAELLYIILQFVSTDLFVTSQTITIP